MTEFKRPAGIGSGGKRLKKKEENDNSNNDNNDNSNGNEDHHFETETFYELAEDATEIDELRVLWQSAKQCSISKDDENYTKKMYYAVANECDRLLSEDNLKADSKSEFYRIYGECLLYLAMNDDLLLYIESAIEVFEKVGDESLFQLACARFINYHVQNRSDNNNNHYHDQSLKKLLLCCNYRDESNASECLKVVSFIDGMGHLIHKNVVIDAFLDHDSIEQFFSFSIRVLLDFVEFCQDYIEESLGGGREEEKEEKEKEENKDSINFEYLNKLLNILEKMLERAKKKYHQNDNNNNNDNDNDDHIDKLVQIENVRIQNMLLFGSLYSLLEREYYQRAHDISLNLERDHRIPVPEYIKELLEND